MAIAATLALLFVALLVLAQLLQRGKAKQAPLVLLGLLAAVGLPLALGAALLLWLRPALEARGMGGGAAAALTLGSYLIVALGCVAWFIRLLRGVLQSSSARPPDAG